MKYKLILIDELVWTFIAAIILYKWRWFTFIIWTEAAIIDHSTIGNYPSHPHLTVALLEFFVLAQIFIAIRIISTLATTKRMFDITRFLKWFIKGAK